MNHLGWILLIATFQVQSE